MMNWLYKDCETGNNQKNGATDADIDIAFALVVASKQWPKDEKYLSLANDLIDRLQQYNFTECDGLIVQKPGDAFGGCSCTNPSYYAPAYYRVFSDLKRKNNEASRALFWLNAAKDSYVILNKNAHPETGLVYAWTNADGKDPKDCYYEVSGSGTYNSYQYDACRVPWRLANDYLWFGNKEAEAFTQKITNFVTKPIYKQSAPNGNIWYGAGGIENVVDGYWPNGLRRINPDKPSWGHRHTSPFVGSFVLSSMSSNNQLIVDEFMEELSKLKIERYYESCLHVLYTFLASGNYWNPMDMN
jgi:hypothetical protein